MNPKRLKLDEKIFVYKNVNHATNLNNMRLNNKWCDVTISVDGREFRAHKVILAANLKYFETMFSNDSFQESKQDVIAMEGIVGTAFEEFVSYAYTGEILLTDSNALDLLELANYLGEDDIKNACAELLEKYLNKEQVYQTYHLAYTIGCLSLKNAAKSMILSDFIDGSKTIDYLNLLDYEQLMDILSEGKSPPAIIQQKFFETIMRWIMHNVKERMIHVNNLLKSIDITTLSADYLLSHLYRSVVDNKDEYGIMRDVMFYYQSNKSQQIVHQIEVPKQLWMLFAFKDKKINFQFYDLTKKTWSPLEEITNVYDNLYAIGAILNDQLYYISENSQGNYLSVFNPMTKRNLILESPKSILSHSALCTCGRFLFLCGGLLEGHLISNQILRYDSLAHSFGTLAPLRTKRCGAVAIFYQGCLHVLGGYDGGTDRLKSVEKYDPEKKEWVAFPSMCEGRTAHAPAILDGKLYICGGTNSNSVEVYDPLKHSWQPVASMSKRRWFFLVSVYEGKLFAIGGDEGGAHNRSIEVYDPKKNEWQMDDELSSGLLIGRPIGGLISSSCIANAN